MALKRFLKKWIDVEVRGRFRTLAEIRRDLRERIRDELGAPNAALFTELSAYATKVDTAVRAAEKKWPARTTNDAIDAAFVALNASGIVALQNAGYTMSDGWEDTNEVASALKKRPSGGAFYHGQDLERGVAGEGLMITFGAYETNAKKRDVASLAVARDIVQTLERFGVKTAWNGTVAKRIEIKPFTWRRR